MPRNIFQLIFRFMQELGTLSKSVSNVSISAGNREKAKTWIRERASIFMNLYNTKLNNSTTVESGFHPATSILTQLIAAIKKLAKEVCFLEYLNEALNCSK